jgi:hypothetical protein
MFAFPTASSSAAAAPSFFGERLSFAVKHGQYKSNMRGINRGNGDE